VIDAGIGYPGLVAGQLTGAFDMPAVVFSYEVTGDGLLVPDDYVQPGYMLHGSGRAPEWFHMGNAMTRIHSRNPEWFVSWGGHAGALGCVIYSQFLHEFKIALVHEVGLAEEYARLNSIPGSINVIEVHDSDAGLVQEYCDYIATLEPFGQGFGRVPVKYSIELGTLQAIKTMGAEQQHLKLATGVFDVLIWNYQTKAHIEKVMSGPRGSVVEFTGTLGVNEWNGRVTPQFVVDTIL
jgi:single-strand DNA-specific exonuclease